MEKKSNRNEVLKNEIFVYRLNCRMHENIGFNDF
jgi:hypothetical protein